MGLSEFERRLERMIEGAFAKAFRSGLQPVEIGRRIAREMDLNRTVGMRGTIVPNCFTVTVSQPDHARLEGLGTTLTRDLADYAREHARSSGYHVVGPVEVSLDASETGVGKGEFLVAGEVREGPGGGPGGMLVLGDGSRVDLGEEPVLIGRQSDCEVQIGDPGASRRHAEVRREPDGGFTIIDLSSLNGTRVNGAGVRAHRLADGDEITIGATKIVFREA